MKRMKRIKQRKQIRRILAGCLAVSMLLPQMAEPVLAAAPKVEVDESLYVNLGHYGEIEKINVVKGYVLNGETEIEDYGEYNKVTNMTNTILPKIEDGKVTWSLEEKTDSFFYQAGMQADAVELPWNLDVTYRLNGRTVKAEELGGASGIIEIRIKAEPNEKAEEYYKNNMILAIIVPVDSSVCYSVDAPDAQFQSLGTISAAVFSVLPGEEQEFRVSLGSDNFSFAGVVGMMMPATINSLEHLQDLNEMRDTWKDEGDAMYQSIHTLLLQMESMKGDLSELRSGVDTLDSARKTWNQSKGELRTNADQALYDLDSLTEQMEYLIPHLETGQNLLEDIHADMEELSDTLLTAQDDMDTLYDRIRKMQEHLEDLNRLVVSLGPDTGKIMESVEEAEICLDELEAWFETVQGTHQNVKKSTKKIGEARRDYKDEQTSASLLYDVSLASDSNASEIWDSVSDSLSEWEENDESLEQIGAEIENLEEVWDTAIKKAEEWMYQIRNLLDFIKGLVAMQNQMQVTANDGDRLVSGTRAALDTGNLLMDNMICLIDTLDAYYPNMQNGMEDITEMSQRMSNTMNSTSNLLHQVQQVMQTTGDQLDAGAKDSMEATSDILGKSVEMLDQIGEVREASEQIKSIVDEKSDKLENESSVLQIDPDAEKLSFTSSKNQEPRSIQIMVRTEEISEDEDAQAVTASVDMETTSSESGFQRMWNVLVRMWDAVVRIFKER